MTTYKITIKDNSIPEHMQHACPCFKPIHEDIITCYDNKTICISQGEVSISYNIIEFINELARELDTDPESLEILSIIKQ